MLPQRADHQDHQVQPLLEMMTTQLATSQDLPPHGGEKYGKSSYFRESFGQLHLGWGKSIQNLHEIM